MGIASDRSQLRLGCIAVRNKYQIPGRNRFKVLSVAREPGSYGKEDQRSPHRRSEAQTEPGSGRTSDWGFAKLDQVWSRKRDDCSVIDSSPRQTSDDSFQIDN